MLQHARYPATTAARFKAELPDRSLVGQSPSFLEARHQDVGSGQGYVSDPDGHAREIAWNPAWTIDERGLVTFGI